MVCAPPGSVRWSRAGPGVNGALLPISPPDTGATKRGCPGVGTRPVERTGGLVDGRDGTPPTLGRQKPWDFGPIGPGGPPENAPSCALGRRGPEEGGPF